MNPIKALAGLFKNGGLSPEKILTAIDGLSTSAEEKGSLRLKVVESVIKAQSAALVAEVSSDNWLAKSWRPLASLAFVGIIVCKYSLFPMIAAAWPSTTAVLSAMEVPPDLWNVVLVCLGGYTFARTGEKLAKVVSPLMSAKQEIKKLKLQTKMNGDDG